MPTACGAPISSFRHCSAPLRADGSCDACARRALLSMNCAGVANLGSTATQQQQQDHQPVDRGGPAGGERKKRGRPRKDQGEHRTASRKPKSAPTSKGREVSGALPEEQQLRPVGGNVQLQNTQQEQQEQVGVAENPTQQHRGSTEPRDAADTVLEQPVKRKRGRPRKYPPTEASGAVVPTAAENCPQPSKPGSDVAISASIAKGQPAFPTQQQQQKFAPAKRQSATSTQQRAKKLASAKRPSTISTQQRSQNPTQILKPTIHEHHLPQQQPQLQANAASEIAPAMLEREESQEEHLRRGIAAAPPIPRKIGKVILPPPPRPLTAPISEEIAMLAETQAVCGQKVTADNSVVSITNHAQVARIAHPAAERGTGSIDGIVRSASAPQRVHAPVDKRKRKKAPPKVSSLAKKISKIDNAAPARRKKRAEHELLSLTAGKDGTKNETSKGAAEESPRPVKRHRSSISSLLPSATDFHEEDGRDVANGPTYRSSLSTNDGSGFAESTDERRLNNHGNEISLKKVAAERVQLPCDAPASLCSSVTRKPADLMRTEATKDHLMVESQDNSFGGESLQKLIARREQGLALATGAHGGAQCMERAAQLFSEVACDGDAEAQFYLGLLHVEGVSCVHPDIGEGVRWFRNAAEQGHPAARLMLALRTTAAGLVVPQRINPIRRIPSLQSPSTERSRESATSETVSSATEAKHRRSSGWSLVFRDQANGQK